MSALRIIHLLLALWLVACSGDINQPARDAGHGPSNDGSVEPPPNTLDAGDAEAPPVGTSDAGTDATTTELDGSVAPEPDAGSDGGVPECNSDCPEDDLRCSDDAVEHCVRGEDGCLSWQVEDACDGSTPRCAQTAGSASCEAARASCDDETENQDETDMDCGGAVCDGCGLEQSCTLQRDCALGVCTDGTCTAPAATCEDLFARPSGYAAPNTLPWPLISQSTGEPRRAIGNTFGEFQNFGDVYVHTGIDIRGAAGDYVKVVVNGNIWLTANLAECEDNLGNTCRLYIKDLSGRYIYYYSHLLLSSTDAMTVELRAQIMNASAKGSGSYAVQPGTEVTAGQTLSAITNFANGQWPHLHFGIFDTTQNYDGINPLLALDLESYEPAIIDDEPPYVEPPTLTAVGSVATLAPLRCDEATGALDVRAMMSDSFFTADPAPEAVPSQISNNGLYGATLFIRNVESGEVDRRVWYDMGSVPFDCVGPLRGTQCPAQLSEADFFARSIDLPSGAPHVGNLVTPLLFDVSQSSSAYLGGEYYSHVLTHSGGIPGMWSTVIGPDGIYQVSVEARDHAGNRGAASRFVVVDNSGGFDATSSTPDVYVRDHDRDEGAVPSTLGNAPAWASPDIFIVPTGTPVDVGSEPSLLTLTASTSYDLYVRVHNDGCAPLDGIRVRLSAMRADLGGEDERTAITPAGSFVTDVSHASGLSLAPSSTGLLGPFAFSPTAELIGQTGTFSVLAEIDAAGDARANASNELDNNAAIRTVSLAPSAEAPAFWFGNGSAADACVQLVFERVALPITDTLATLVVPNDPALSAAWASVPGALIEPDGDTLRITLLRARVALPPVVLPAGSSLLAEVAINKGASSGGVRFYQYIGGELSGGIELR